MNANGTNNKSLKVVYRYDEDAPLAHNVTPYTEGATQETLSEAIHHILDGLRRFFTSIYHQIDHRLLWVFKYKSGVVILKICILAIIMFLIFKEDVALDVKIPKFASEKETKEKTHSNKHKIDYANPASLGSIVSHDLSPAAPEDLREAQVKSYIERYSNTAIGEMDNFGIPASIAMAQAIVESRSGTSILAVKNNNHFGIKCFSKSCPKGHCSNHTDDHHKDFFRKYAGSWESWRAHSEFLMKHSYRRLLKYGKNYREWAKGLREIGYATDTQYDKKLIAIIQKYELYKLDDL
jgi:flagellum-specific peptidoglycan hydrolase FlgJ